jgi:hypothetical protein
MGEIIIHQVIRKISFSPPSMLTLSTGLIFLHFLSSRHDRVLPRMYLQHCFLPSIVGAFARSRPTFRSFVEHDDRVSFRDGRSSRDLLPRRYVHNVVRSHHCNVSFHSFFHLRVLSLLLRKHSILMTIPSSTVSVSWKASLPSCTLSVCTGSNSIPSSSKELELHSSLFHSLVPTR